MPCTLCGSDYHSTSKCPWRLKTLTEWAVASLCALAFTGVLGYLVYAAVAVAKGHP